MSSRYSVCQCYNNQILQKFITSHFKESNFIVMGNEPTPEPSKQLQKDLNKFTGLSPSMVNFSKFFNFQKQQNLQYLLTIILFSIEFLKIITMMFHFIIFLTLSINLQYINISICYLLNRYRKFVYEEVQILGIHLVRIKINYQIIYL
ncbi:hypothetical protein ABPG73_011076 [Tetrahymena malaccensis]